MQLTLKEKDYFGSTLQKFYDKLIILFGALEGNMLQLRLEGKPGKRRVLGLTIVFEDNFNDIKIPHKVPSQQGSTTYHIKHTNLWGNIQNQT